MTISQHFSIVNRLQEWAYILWKYQLWQYKICNSKKQSWKGTKELNESLASTYFSPTYSTTCQSWMTLSLMSERENQILNTENLLLVYAPTFSFARIKCIINRKKQVRPGSALMLKSIPSERRINKCKSMPEL